MTSSTESSFADSDGQASEIDDAASPPIHGFSGTTSRWRRFTRRERALASSLDALEAADLGIHLYNAHAWKRRLYNTTSVSPPPLARVNDGIVAGFLQPQNKSRWLQSNAWRPDHRWTSWPVEYWAAEHDSQAVAQELYECLEACMSSCARISYDRRPCAASPSQDNARRRRERRAAAHAASTTDASDFDATDGGVVTDAESLTDITNRRSSRASTPALSMSSPKSVSHSASRRDVPQQDKAYVPVPLADEDRVHSLLAPHVRHVAAQLDNLLLALHRARAAVDDGGSSSSSEGESGGDSVKSEPEHSRGESVERESNVSETSVDSRTAERLQKRRKTHGQKRLKPPRDWSEVLGMAALKGWDSKVLERTRTRCVALFGEEMDFARFDAQHAPQSQRGRASGQMRDPLLGDEDNVNKENTNGEGIAQHRGSDHVQQRPNCAISANKKSTFIVDPDANFCTDPTCKLYRKVFAQRFRLNEHLKRRHGYIRPILSRSASQGSGGGETENESDASSGADETMGGVHVDGFLKPIKARIGWTRKIVRRKSREGSRERRGKQRRRHGESELEDIADESS